MYSEAVKPAPAKFLCVVPLILRPSMPAVCPEDRAMESVGPLRTSLEQLVSGPSENQHGLVDSGSCMLGKDDARIFLG